MLYHIVTVAKNNVIGKGNKLPWLFVEDRNHFKRVVAGNTVIMGRKTYESLGKPVPDCQNFVLSKTCPAGGSQPKFFDALGDALGEIQTPHAFIIGGMDLFMQTLPLVDGVYMTRIHQNYEGDAFYPSLPPHFEEQTRSKICDSPKMEIIYYENTQGKGCPCDER